MKYLESLFKTFKKSAGLKFDYEVAPFFNMTPDSFRGTTRERRNDIKLTCVLIWNLQGKVMADWQQCKECLEIIPDEFCVFDNEKDEMICPCCQKVMMKV